MSTKRRTHWLRTTIAVVVVCGIVGLALTAFLFYRDPNPNYATAVIDFTFDGAADGVAPNGTAFDLSDIKSDEVLTAGLKEANLDGVYKADQIRPSLVVRGSYPEDMAQKVTNYDSLLNFTANREETITEYHPTTYSVTLYNDFDPTVSRVNQEAILQGILSAYKAHFARVYANGLEADDLLFTLDDYDYPQQLEIIQNHLEMMSGYAQEMYARRPAFRSGGAGFNDISVRLNNLVSSDIARLNADLTINALTRNTARLLTQYQFEIRDLNNQLEKQTEQLTKLDELVAAYDKNEIIYLSTSNSLTKIDGNSSETYDKLVDQRKEVADGITEINSRIATYQLKLSDLLKEEASEAASTTAVGDKKPAAAAKEAEQADAGEGSEGETETETETTTTDDIVAMTEEEIAAAAEEAERLARAQVNALEKNIAALVEKGDAIIDDFEAMLKTYRDQEINDLTVSVSHFKYKTPKLLSGAFIKMAIKTAGPICALGFMVCMVLIIISRRREMKELPEN